MEPVMQFDIEYECECEHGMCSHATQAVTDAMQRAYHRGVEDGIRHTVTEIRTEMQRAAPMSAKKSRGLPPISKKKQYSN